VKNKSTNQFHPPIWGIFLIFLGIIFLLQTLNVLPWSFWSTLWRFWPVLIIIAGLVVLLGGRKPWLVTILVILILGTSLGIALWQHRSAKPVVTGEATYTQSQAGLAAAQIEVSFQTGKLILEEEFATPNLVEVLYEDSSLSASFSNENGTGILNLKSDRSPSFSWEKHTDWMVKLTPALPLTIDINTAASNLELDMNNLRLTQFDLESSASRCEIIMPVSGKITADISASVSDVTITIPSSMAARIKTDTSVASVSVDQERFPRNDNYYISPGYDSAVNQLDLKLDCSVGSIKIK